MAELKKMKASNPKNMKKDVLRFANNWSPVREPSINGRRRPSASPPSGSYAIQHLEEP